MSLEETMRAADQASEKLAQKIQSASIKLFMNNDVGFDNFPCMVFIVNDRGFFVAANSVASSVLGYTNAELLSKPFQEFIAPESIKYSMDFYEKHAHVLKGAKTGWYKNVYITKDGGTIDMYWIWEEAFKVNGQSIAVAVTRRPIFDISKPVLL